MVNLKGQFTQISKNICLFSHLLLVVPNHTDSLVLFAQSFNIFLRDFRVNCNTIKVNGILLMVFHLYNKEKTTTTTQ